MTAAEARQKAHTANQNCRDNQFVNIMTEIEKECAFGKYEINLYDNIREDVITMLIQEGFSVEIVPDSRDGDCYKISW